MEKHPIGEMLETTMGKLRDIFERALDASDASEMPDYYTQGYMIHGGLYASDPTAYSAAMDIASWSMQKYRESVVDEVKTSPEAREKWDELEKSIVVNIADEVRIAITDGKVEMAVYKKFKDPTE